MAASRTGPPIGDVARAFDDWIRTRFVELNTQLEALYFARPDRSDTSGVGEREKSAIRDEGLVHVRALLAEGNTGDGFESAFGVLGNVGMYLAALRRHELTNPARETQSPFPEASSLALHVGASIGMAPRFATAHLTTHNPARLGLRKSFTTLSDEFLFIDENARAILHLQRAADALARIPPLGVSNPVADVQFAAAIEALRMAERVSAKLFETLDVDRFFFSVRPYYKPYRVGREVYRGANAGDFAGVNQIDLLLGLAQASDPYYAQLLVDKRAFMTPDEQARLRETMRLRSLLDEFLALEAHAGAPWFEANATAFLDACDAFAAFARRHHNELVARFIVSPAAALPPEATEGLTASGPPLPELIAELARLRDIRCAAPRTAFPTRAADLQRLRSLVGRRPHDAV